MAKAWRLEAEIINQRRAAGSKEPSSRQQKQDKQITHPIRGSGNYLLDGLLIKEGYLLPEFQPQATDKPVSKPGWFNRIISRLFK